MTLYSRAARTTAPSAVEFDGSRLKGLTVYLKIHQAGAGGGLAIRMFHVGPSGDKVYTNAAGTNRTAAGNFAYTWRPDLASLTGTSDFVEKYAVPMSQRMGIEIVHANTDSYDYEVQAEGQYA